MATTGNTNKSISQYLHFYIGCDVCREHSETRSKKFFEYAKHVGISKSEIEPDKMVVILDVGLDHFHEWYVDEVKLILRKLSSMTEEEAREVIFLMDTIRRDDPIKILKLNNINIPFWLGENKIARYVSFNALNPNQFTHLLSKGFDLFGLIDAGLAIEKDSGLALDKENK